MSNSPLAPGFLRSRAARDLAVFGGAALVVFLLGLLALLG